MANQPKKLGKYDIVGKIGKGAMGEVYKGHDPVLNRDVAIKVIAETLDAETDLVERFKREARNAAQLNHPNIVTIFDFVEDEGHLYMVMELLEGQDLKELIKSGKALTIDQILSIMEQIADGLAFAHSKDIIHRDLKPANIHLSHSGQVKILDFGLVKEAASDMTKTGQVMGTPNYMSPEQVQGLKVDPRSDIFSLGAVFYELLTRKKPFSADSIHATMFKVVQGDREPLQKYTHLPRPIVDMVDRALDKEPEGRFEDAAGLREHLRLLRRDVLAGQDADSTMTTAEEATILTPPPEPGSHPSSPALSGSGSAASAPGRSGSVVSASRGTMRRREIAGQSVGATASTSRSRALYAVIGLVILAAGAGAYFMTRSPETSDPDVQALSKALVESQEQLMLASLEQKDYEGALTRAEELLENDPANATALRVSEESHRALGQIDAAVAEARAALESGDTAAAAEALSRVLALDPAHPLGTELSSQLNQHFQSQADRARGEMESARSAAAGAGATGRPEFERADVLREEATAEFNRAEYTNAAQRYLEAGQAYGRAQSAYQQAQQQRAQATRENEVEAAAVAAQRGKLRDAESTWTRLRQQPVDASIERQPSYQRAISEESVAKRLATAGDLEGAAQAYASAVTYYERARRELLDAERAAQQEAARSAAVTTAPPSPPSTSSAPGREQEEAAIRQVLANYVRAVETEDIALFRQVKPNLSADEEQRLNAAFSSTDSHDVELGVDAIALQGDTAQVSATRSDVFVIRGRSQKSDPRPQSFTLQKTAAGWVIVALGQ